MSHRRHRLQAARVTRHMSTLPIHPVPFDGHGSFSLLPIAACWLDVHTVACLRHQYCRVLRLVHIRISTAPVPYQGCLTRTYAILRGGSTDDCLCVRCTLVESYDGPPRTVYVNHTDHTDASERVRVSLCLARTQKLHQDGCVILPRLLEMLENRTTEYDKYTHTRTGVLNTLWTRRHLSHQSPPGPRTKGAEE